MKSLYTTTIVPPAGLAQEIRTLQQEFADRYGTAAALKPPVHTTFSPPEHLDPSGADDYQQQLTEVCKEAVPFEITLSGFDCFLKNKVMFIAVAPCEPLMKLEQAFRSRKNSKETRPYHPHITIGYRNMLPEVFERAVEDYKSRTFNASFMVDALYVWKHEGGMWKTVGRVDFEKS